MLTIGLTGGIGSGKTTVAKHFQSLGIDIIDADQVARDVVKPNTIALEKITQHFGSTILQADGTLNRDALRKIVFQDSSQLEWLNQLLHPIIRSELMNQAQRAKSDYVILDVPLLIDNNMTNLVERVLVVDLPVKTQIERAAQRDNTTTDQIRAIIENQVSREERLSLADDVIDNSKSIDEVKEAVSQLHQYYLSLRDCE